MRGMLVVVVVATGMLIAAGQVVGCIEGRARVLGSPCGADRDCREGLVCRYGRCRTRCTFDLDCPEGASCVPAGPDRSDRVCLLAEEQGCGSASDPCPGEIVCLGGRCGAPCDPSDGDEECPPPRECCSSVCLESCPEADGDADGDADADADDGGDADGPVDGDTSGPVDADVDADADYDGVAPVGCPRSPCGVAEVCCYSPLGGYECTAPAGCGAILVGCRDDADCTSLPGPRCCLSGTALRCGPADCATPVCVELLDCPPTALACCPPPTGDWTGPALVCWDDYCE